jgi:hypothetical protein
VKLEEKSGFKEKFGEEEHTSQDPFAKLPKFLLLTSNIYIWRGFSAAKKTKL